MKLDIIFAALCVLSVWQTEAQIYDTNNFVVQTFAGSGFSGYVNGVGQLTMFEIQVQLSLIRMATFLYGM